MGQLLGSVVDHRKTTEVVFRSWMRSSEQGGKQLYLKAEEVQKYFSQEQWGGVTVEAARRLLGLMVYGGDEERVGTAGVEEIMLQQFTQFVESTFVAEFDTMDSNHDGYIDLMECVRHKIKQLEKDSHSRTDPSFPRTLLIAVKQVMRYDHGDGRVSFHEYVEGRTYDILQRIASGDTTPDCLKG